LDTEAKEKRHTELLEICFNCFCENGISQTGMRKLGEACGMSAAGLFAHFTGKDQIITESTAYCMAKVEEDFLSLAPKNAEDLERFLKEMPYITREKHGAKYRFMYQIYTQPAYMEQGKAFFNGVYERYTEYAKELAPKIGIAWEDLQSLIFMFVRASVHYAMFGNEEYLQSQMRFLLKAVKLLRQNTANTGKGKKDDENLQKST